MIDLRVSVQPCVSVQKDSRASNLHTQSPARGFPVRDRAYSGRSPGFSRLRFGCLDARISRRAFFRSRGFSLEKCGNSGIPHSGLGPAFRVI